MSSRALNKRNFMAKNGLRLENIYKRETRDQVSMRNESEKNFNQKGAYALKLHYTHYTVNAIKLSPIIRGLIGTH